MFLDKVKDLEQIKLGKNQVLVELIYKTYESSVIITDTTGGSESTNELIKTSVVASNYEDVAVGDVLIEYRLMMGQNGMLKVGDKTFAVVMGHDIKLWTEPNNYDETKELEKKDTLIQTAKSGLTEADRRKIESEATGLSSKHLNNK